MIDSCIKEVIASEPYRKMLYETNNFAVIPADSAEKIVEEGKYLRHCVASYIPDFYTGDIFLYFLREKKALDTPYFTLEVKQKGTRYALTQCYTFDDATDKSPECEAFIRQWCSKKRIKIDCNL